MSQATVVTVSGDAPYDVVIGHGVVDRVRSLVGDAARVAVFHAPSVSRYAEEVVDALPDVEVVSAVLPDAEAAKTLDVLSEAWNLLGARGFTRSDVIVSIGGGATTDVGGFIAASWLRGVGVVHVPTTTLGMVDAAVGGKTGINTSAGKNLVGAFHAPKGVLVDLDVLASLPLEEHRAGLAEIVKAGFIADPAILDLIESDPLAALDPSSSVVRELVERAIAVKAKVVGADLREVATLGVSREILNYGHTLGHAIEKQENYQWRHGHAVSVGMMYAAEVAALTGRLDAAVVERHRSVLTALGLPTSYGGDWEALLSAMRIDKKARGSVLRLVLLDGVADPVVVPAPSDEVLGQAYERIAP